MSPKFREMSSIKELSNLEKPLMEKLPDSAQMLNLIRLSIRKRFPESMHITIYKYEKDAYESTTDDLFLVCTQIPNLNSPHCVITFGPENPSPEMLDTIDKFINWDKVHLFSNINKSFLKHIQALCNKHGNLTPEEIPGFMYVMDVNKAKELRLPQLSSCSSSNGHGIMTNWNSDNNNEPNTDPKDINNIEVKPLSTQHAEKMAKNWKWAQPHSQSQLEETIKSLYSCGTFVNSELATWVILSPFTTIAMLYTDENFRRKGYAEMTMAAITKSVALDGIIPMSEVEIWNDKPAALLEKLGFQKAYGVCYVFFKK